MDDEYKMTRLIECENISKRYHVQDAAIDALQDICFSVKQGEFLTVKGPSGCGKSTLLMICAGMLRPDSGRLRFGSQNLYELTYQERATFRARQIGFVFQMFHLIPYLNCIENVRLADRAPGSGNHTKSAVEILRQFGLSERLHNKPSQLSAGEKQRLAIARAMVNQPACILADEPTGNLDPDNAHFVLKTLDQYCKDGGTVILVTHGNLAEEYTDRVISLKQGKLCKISPPDQK